MPRAGEAGARHFPLALRSAAPELQAAGFVLQQSWRCRVLVCAGDEAQDYFDIWHQPQLNLHALVGLHTDPACGQCYEIRLLSAYADGHSLLSCWRGSPGLPRLQLPQPELQLDLCTGGSLQALLDSHLQARNPYEGRARLPAGALWQHMRKQAESLLPFAQRAGSLRICAERDGQRPLYRLRPLAALRLSLQHARAAFWRWRARRQWQQTDAALLHVAHSWHWQQAWAQAWQSVHWPTPRRWWPVLLPAAVCGLLVWRAQSLIALGVLVLVLGLHLVWLGLQAQWADWQRRQPRASRLRHPLLMLAGLLAGPALGIGLALGLLLALVQGWLLPDQDGALFWLIAFTLVLQLGQLLPLRIYSGGQMLDLLLPWPWPRLLLCLLTLASLLLLSAWLPLPRRLPLLVLVLLLAWRIPALWRSASAQRLLQRHAPDAASATPPFALWRALARVRLHGASGKQLLAQTLAAQALRVRPGLSSAVFGLSLYALCALLPLLTLSGLVLLRPAQSVQLLQQGMQVVWPPQQPLRTQPQANNTLQRRS